MKHHAKKVLDFLKQYGVVISLLLSFVSMATSGYVLYLALSGNYAVALTGPNGVIIPSPEKIMKELPKNIPVLGNAKAKIMIIEVGDFQCPYCGRFFTDTLPTLRREYIDNGKVGFAYLDYAFLGQESINAAFAAKCANEQGKFWDYYYKLYSNQKGENIGAFNANNLKKFASDIGLDMSLFNSCVSSGKYTTQINDELALGKKYGISATPSFIVGNKLIKGAVPVSQFESIINDQL